MKPALKRIRQVLTGVLIAALVLIGVGPTVLPIFGYELLAVRSGSMEPTIHTGALVSVDRLSVAELNQLGTGDVITFHHPGSPGQLVTHRIYEVTRDGGGELAFRTKGDANGLVDTWTVARSAVVGKQTADFPGVGYGYVFMTSWPVRVGGIVLVLLIAFFPTTSSKGRKEDAPAASVTPVAAD